MDTPTEIFHLIDLSDYTRIASWIEKNAKNDKCIINSHCDTPLLHAIKTNKTIATKMFIKSNMYINSCDLFKNFPLHWASFKGLTPIISLLIQNGANVEVRNSYGETPLHDASQAGFCDAVFVLIEKGGANINSVDFKKKSPLYYSKYCCSQLLLNEGAGLLFDCNARRYFTNANNFEHVHLLFFYHLKLQKFITIFKSNKLRSNLNSRVILKFSATFKFSFKE